MLTIWMGVSCCLLLAGIGALLFMVRRRHAEIQVYKRRFSSVLDAEQELKRIQEEREEFLRQEAALRTAALAEHQRELARRERQAEEQMAQRQAELATLVAEHEQSVARLLREGTEFTAQEKSRRALLSKEYEEALATYLRLKEQVAVLEQDAEDISFGLYQPHFDFDTPEQYKIKMTQFRAEEKLLVRKGLATECPRGWTLGSDYREGQRLVKAYSKLMLRAFNGECEAAMADISWSNALKMEERIANAFTGINQLGSVLSVSISYDYRNVKLNELQLKHEYEQKRYEEREKQRRIREQIREEERGEREIEKARVEAETEEARFQKALEQARKEAAKATSEQLQQLTERVVLFEAKLDEARRKKERAISRAQLTKSGFVYVISNIGSFGDRVYKIGMTRRLEPRERIYELSGASVPFPYDLHAMLYSDNAPELEGALHRFFDDKRLNLANPRREFYKDVELSAIEQFVAVRGLSAQFTATPEAREYRETLAIRQQRAGLPAKTEQIHKLQDQLFAETPNGSTFVSAPARENGQGATR